MRAETRTRNCATGQSGWYVRIIVLSDTHDCHPYYVLDSIADFKSDMVMHNGDFKSYETYNIYKSLAPEFHGVRGDKDEQLDLREKNVIKVGGFRIGQIHGSRSAWREKPSAWFNQFTRGRRYWWNQFAEDAVAQFDEELDVLVTGHLHVPIKCRVNQTWVINPGAIVVNNRQHHLEWPTVGIVELHEQKSEPDISFFELREGQAPVPLRVGPHGPIRDRNWRIANNIFGEGSGSFAIPPSKPAQSWMTGEQYELGGRDAIY